MSNYAGIDYSMSNPSITIFDSNLNKYFFYSFSKVKKHVFQNDFINVDVLNTEWQTSEERFDKISNDFINIILKHSINHCFLEGYAMGAMGKVFDIAENTAILKHKLYKQGISVVIIPPKTVKKYFTGNGNADKMMMCDTFYQKYDSRLYELIGCKQYNSPENDIVDSYAILQCGLNDLKKDN